MSDEGKEETLNSLLALKVAKYMSGDEPFTYLHQPPETAKRKRGKGKSPTPDSGFMLYENPRTIWPIEGKVLKQETDLTAYIAEIRGNFLTARYATFSREGAMLGYLFRGDPNAALDEIGTRLKTKLDLHPHFSDRPHRISAHTRKQRSPRNSTEEFHCHHLILLIPASSN
jgi:hypothetical protein